MLKYKYIYILEVNKMSVWGSIADLIQAIVAIAAFIMAYMSWKLSKENSKKKPHLTFDVVNNGEGDGVNEKGKGYKVVCVNSGDEVASLKRNVNRPYINDNWVSKTMKTKDGKPVKTGWYTEEVKNGIFIQPGETVTLMRIRPSFFHILKASKNDYSICFKEKVSQREYKYKFDMDDFDGSINLAPIK